MRVEMRIFGHVTYMAFVSQQAAMNGLAVESDFAAGQIHQPGDRLHGGGFAGPHGEGDAIDGGDAGPPFGADGAEGLGFPWDIVGISWVFLGSRGFPRGRPFIIFNDISGIKRENIFFPGKLEICTDFAQGKQYIQNGLTILGHKLGGGGNPSGRFR